GAGIPVGGVGRIAGGGLVLEHDRLDALVLVDVAVDVQRVQRTDLRVGGRPADGGRDLDDVEAGQVSDQQLAERCPRGEAPGVSRQRRPAGDGRVRPRHAVINAAQIGIYVAVRIDDPGRAVVVDGDLVCGARRALPAAAVPVADDVVGVRSGPQVAADDPRV